MDNYTVFDRPLHDLPINDFDEAKLTDLYKKVQNVRNLSDTDMNILKMVTGKTVRFFCSNCNYVIGMFFNNTESFNSKKYYAMNSSIMPDEKT